jgi:biotin operon repressor
MNLSDKLLAAIGKGEENARSSTTLRIITGSSDRELRKNIERLRRSGHVIVSCEHGYYIPSTLAEVQRHIRKETARAHSIFYTLESAKELEKRMLNRSQHIGTSESEDKAHD